jgi:lipopolysaccharide export system protein LptA
MKRIAAVLLAGCGALAAPAHADKSDRDKPLNYEADSGECDDLKQVCALVGNVVLVKGTMRATGERVQIRKDPEGYQHGVLLAAPGKLVSFRQRRDPTKPGIEEYVGANSGQHVIHTGGEHASYLQLPIQAR